MGMYLVRRETDCQPSQISVFGLLLDSAGLYMLWNSIVLHGFIAMLPAACAKESDTPTQVDVLDKIIAQEQRRWSPCENTPRWWRRTSRFAARTNTWA
jgi:hypothetical protein